MKSKQFENFAGMFVSFEGPDGSGKTSVVPHAVEVLKAHGIEPVVVRQPGGSPYAEMIRNLVLGTKDTGEPVQNIAEALLFAAARAQCLESVIKPALREGKMVIADRWYDSNYAYQGVGRGMEAEVLALEEIVEGVFRPDRTIFLDLPLDVAQARLAGRIKEFNRMNAEEMAFKGRTFQGYQVRFAENPDRMVPINADQPLESVKSDIAGWITGELIPLYKEHQTFLDRNNPDSNELASLKAATRQAA